LGAAPDLAGVGKRRVPPVSRPRAASDKGLAAEETEEVTEEVAEEESCAAPPQLPLDADEGPAEEVREAIAADEAATDPEASTAVVPREGASSRVSDEVAESILGVVYVGTAREYSAIDLTPACRYRARVRRIADAGLPSTWSAVPAPRFHMPKGAVRLLVGHTVRIGLGCGHGCRRLGAPHQLW